MPQRAHTSGSAVRPLRALGAGAAAGAHQRLRRAAVVVIATGMTRHPATITPRRTVGPPQRTAGAGPFARTGPRGEELGLRLGEATASIGSVTA
ncbi:hypothetical protein GCM10010297_04360 [Streptomyces malachitofuscus]|nr:hypothetical protein GCM10010297_04360 [Streptomyces malachitofuscus]